MNALMFCNILVAMAPLKCDMDLKENTIYIHEKPHFQRVQLIDLFQKDGNLLTKRTMKMQLILSFSQISTRKLFLTGKKVLL